MSIEDRAKLPAQVGDRFGVFNGDAKGTVELINTQKVSYRFDHDLETRHEHSILWFNSSTFPLPKDTKVISTL